MNPTPTSGPMANSNTHHALETISSRHSFSSSHTGAVLRERKKHLFEARSRTRCIAVSGYRGKLFNGAFAAYPPAAQQNKPVTEPRRIADLVNRKKQSPPPSRVRSQRARHVPCLPQIEPFERFVDEQRRLRRQQSDAQQHPLPLPFRERAHRLVEQRPQVELFHYLFAQVFSPPQKPDRKIERPTHALRRPRRDPVRHIEQE